MVKHFSEEYLINEQLKFVYTLVDQLIICINWNHWFRLKIVQIKLNRFKITRVVINRLVDNRMENYKTVNDKMKSNYI